MLFIFAALLLPALFIRHFWRITLELERLARSITTPQITPPPAPALLDVAPPSPPSPLDTVGEVSDDFATDFAFGLCGIAAVVACYVLLWGVVRMDLFGQIRNGAVRIARHIHNVAVRFARCVSVIATDVVHLAHQLVLAADLLVSKLYDVVLVCLSAALWSTLPLLVLAIAFTWIAAISLYLVLHAIHFFATGTGVEYPNVDLRTPPAKELVMRSVNGAPKVLTTTNEDTFGLGSNLLVDNQEPTTKNEDTFGLGSNLLVANQEPTTKNEDTFGLGSNLLVANQEPTTKNEDTFGLGSNLLVVNQAPTADVAISLPVASAAEPVVVFCPPSRPRSKLVAWPNKHYGHRHMPYVLERQLCFFFAGQHRRHRRQRARRLAFARTFGLPPVRLVGVPVPWCWASEAHAGVPAPVPVASPEPMLVDEDPSVPAASPEPMLVDQPAQAPAAAGEQPVSVVETMLEDDTEPTAAPVTGGAPVVRPCAPVVSPSAPSVRPVAPVVSPSAPSVRPVAPVVRPVAPVVRPTTPAVRLAAPVVRPTAPAVRPTAPVVSPSAPSVRLAAPSVRFAAPSVRPTAPAVRPVAPIVRPTAPIVSPSAPSVRPAAPPAVRSGESGTTPPAFDSGVRYNTVAALLAALPARPAGRPAAHPAHPAGRPAVPPGTPAPALAPATAAATSRAAGVPDPLLMNRHQRTRKRPLVDL
ncbi:hypothetical protein DM01DRAFT_1398608 [Hesseltinella vesiculosa]|uniref:Uncharacterized protein n=1 Tax=Hesseltinella vesiculosa TaxID=101127 RepID=A0A1X2G4E3_9FUNG|nr:hypothetical protein DM01DRAFT_1398608 [Hesseltinella vesiculosa]